MFGRFSMVPLSRTRCRIFSQPFSLLHLQRQLSHGQKKKLWDSYIFFLPPFRLHAAEIFSAPFPYLLLPFCRALLRPITWTCIRTFVRVHYERIRRRGVSVKEYRRDIETKSNQRRERRRSSTRRLNFFPLALFVAADAASAHDSDVHGDACSRKLIESSSLPLRAVPAR